MMRIFLQRRDFDPELRHHLDWLDADEAEKHGAVEYRPPIDVIETPEAIEIVADLPGVAPAGVRIVLTGGTLVIAGRKRPPSCDHRDAAFHLAERSFGRFAWGVRLAMAIDATHARAVLEAGELRITLPRIVERRGREIRIAIEPAS
jgi:HSP20 family protein